MGQTMFDQREMLEMSQAQLTDAIMGLASDAGMDRNLLGDALDLAVDVHKGQFRSPVPGVMRDGVECKLPYIEHPLRVSLQLLMVGIKDQNMIAGGLLHDTMEDATEKFVKSIRREGQEFTPRQQVVFEYIGNNINHDVARMTSALTNPPAAEQKGDVRVKHGAYIQHFAEIAQNPKDFPIKISDFIENAGNLHLVAHGDRARRSFYQALKYRRAANIIIANRSILPALVGKVEARRVVALVLAITRSLDSIIHQFSDQFDY